MKLEIRFITVLAILIWLPVAGGGADLGTRQRTIRPVALATNITQIGVSNVPLYSVYGYSSWNWGPGEDEGRKFDLMPAGYTGATHAARLLSFFSMSDVHITDKESPAQIPYFGWRAGFHAGAIFGACYAPTLLSTTHVLDDAVKTVNALHRVAPFDFGICLGDVANNCQYNELRWFIDVMDGQFITPSSGAHLGAETIEYQKPYQAAGLDRSIPWYQVIGNHDQFWMGGFYPSDKIRNAAVGSTILNMAANLMATNATEATGMYVGVVDGSTPYGDVIKGGPANLFDTPPTIVADANRRLLTTDYSSTTNYMSEFFHTTSSPAGHGFQQTNLEINSACYTFEPMANLPIKVIVLDDTAKTNVPNAGASYPASGSIDPARFAWLTNELQLGQNEGKLMILAAHIPINPQKDLYDTNAAPQFSPPPLSSETDSQLIATLHQYPNLMLLIAGHRHVNTVTPQPSPDPAQPEYGFWEVETPSLRDFPQQLRAWEIFRNSDNTISIKTTDVDLQVEEGSPAADSRGYTIGTERILGGLTLADTTPHTYNAELVKPLSPAMQSKIASYGRSLGHRVAIDASGNGATISFLGELQSADNLLGPWTGVTNSSPCAVSAANSSKFYRAVEE